MATTTISRIPPPPPKPAVHIKMSCIIVDKPGTLEMDDTVTNFDPVFYYPEHAMLGLTVCFSEASMSSAVK